MSYPVYCLRLLLLLFYWSRCLSQSSLHLFLVPLFLTIFSRDEIQMKSYTRTNGQPKSSLSQSPASSTPSSPSHPISVSTRPGQAYSSTAATQSPAHKPGGGVKKVTGVGGTTYEISVWVTLSDCVLQPAVGADSLEFAGTIGELHLQGRDGTQNDSWWTNTPTRTEELLLLTFITPPTKANPIPHPTPTSPNLFCCCGLDLTLSNVVFQRRTTCMKIAGFCQLRLSAAMK